MPRRATDEAAAASLGTTDLGISHQTRRVFKMPFEEILHSIQIPWRPRTHDERAREFTRGNCVLLLLSRQESTTGNEMKLPPTDLGNRRFLGDFRQSNHPVPALSHCRDGIHPSPLHTQQFTASDVQSSRRTRQSDEDHFSLSLFAFAGVAARN